MQTNIGSSIQDYCKKINSRLTFTDICSLFLTLVALISLVLFLSYKERLQYKDIVYKEGEMEVVQETIKSNQPFGSKKGKTYTFSWCQGSSRILPSNVVYFSSEKDAVDSGRTLSKLCKK